MQKVARFQIQDILPIALVLVVAGIGLTYGISVIADVRDEFGSTSNEYAAANNTLTGVAKLPAKLPLIVTIIVAAIIIGILVRYLLVRVGG